MSEAIQKRSPQQEALSAHRARLAHAADHFKQALPATVQKYLTPDRLTKIVLSAMSRQPLLLQCTQDSVLKAVMEAASLGLEPGGPLGHAYLVPFKNKKGQYEAQLIVGYRGLISLARRSGTIDSVSANVVYSNDLFEIDLASGEIRHRPFLAGERGDMLAVYSVARFTDSGRHVDFMTKSDVDRIRSRSRAKDSGPWVTDYEEMAKKTVVRRAAKYWPLSTEMMQAFEIDDSAEARMSVSTIEVPPELLTEPEEPETKTGKVAAKLKAANTEEPDEMPDWDKVEQSLAQGAQDEKRAPYNE